MKLVNVIGECNIGYIAIVSDRAGVWTVFVPVWNPPYHLDRHLETTVPAPSVTIMY